MVGITMAKGRGGLSPAAYSPPALPSLVCLALPSFSVLLARVCRGRAAGTPIIVYDSACTRLTLRGVRRPSGRTPRPWWPSASRTASRSWRPCGPSPARRAAATTKQPAGASWRPTRRAPACQRASAAVSAMPSHAPRAPSGVFGVSVLFVVPHPRPPLP